MSDPSTLHAREKKQEGRLQAMALIQELFPKLDGKERMAMLWEHTSFPVGEPIDWLRQIKEHHKTLNP